MQTITERADVKLAFQQFLCEHPDVWDEFVLFSLSAIAAGYSHYSADAILHRIRWHMNIERKLDGFKINNNFSAHFARKFRAQFPHYDGFFRTRVIKKS